MLKLAHTETDVYVKLTKSEFKLLAKTGAANVADGTDVPLTWIKNLDTLAIDNKPALQSVKTNLDNALVTVNNILAIG